MLMRRAPGSAGGLAPQAVGAGEQALDEALQAEAWQ
jgi:hypothetical protein